MQKNSYRKQFHSFPKKQKWTKSKIVSTPNVCNGEPCIKGTRIPVFVILSHLASGDDVRTILENYPRLRKEDVEACRQYAKTMEKPRSDDRRKKR